VQQSRQYLAGSFSTANLFTDEFEAQLSISKKGKVLLQQKALLQPVSAPQSGHNREKQRYLTLQRPFLQQLGVTDAQQQLIPAMSRKWKQINKFIEIFSAAVQDTG